MTPRSEVLNAGIAHGGHPALAVCAANAVVEGKDASIRKLSKAKSAGRIDGMVAMAIGAAPMEEIKPPRQYQMLIL